MSYIRRFMCLALVLLLAACGISDAAPQLPVSVAEAPAPKPEPAISQRAGELVLPNIPAYPSASTFSLQQRTAQQMSLDPAAVVGSVQVATIRTSGEPLDHFRAVAEFYRQALLEHGWTLAVDLGPTALYRRAAATARQEHGLWVTVRAGQSRYEVEAELATFVSSAPIQAPTHSLEHQASWGPFGGAPVTEVFGIVPGDFDTLLVSDIRNDWLLELSSDDGTVRRSIAIDAVTNDDQAANNILGLARDPAGRLLALDRNGTRVVRFLPDRQRQVLVSGLASASGLAVAPDGTIYVANRKRGGVEVFSTAGVALGFWDARLPDDPEPYATPEWIALDAAGTVYVTDSANNRVKHFDQTGQVLSAWGSEGHTPGRFTSPQGVAIGPDGLLYVVDGNPNNRVQIFTTSGVLVGIWWPGANWWEREQRAQIYAASGIAVRPDGRVYVADLGAGEIESFTTSEISTKLAPLPTAQVSQLQEATPAATLRQVPTEPEWMTAASAWLGGRPCQVPCWEGITLGKTTVGEALELLRRHPMIDPASVAVLSARNVQGNHGFDPKDFPDVVAWNWVGVGRTILYSGIAYFDRLHTPAVDLRDSIQYGSPITPDSAQLGQVIYALRVNFATFRADPAASQGRPSLPIALADVQAAFGAPLHVLATSEGMDWHTLSLIYPQQGMILLQYGRSAPQLADTWRPPVVIFSDQPMLDGRFGLSEHRLVPWQGSQPFEFYCRDERGERC